MAKFTVAELRAVLEGLPDHYEVSFEGGLTFARLKRWGDEEFVVCWSEVQAELSPAFKQEHPEVIVALSRFEHFGDTVASVGVPRL